MSALRAWLDEAEALAKRCPTVEGRVTRSVHALTAAEWQDVLTFAERLRPLDYIGQRADHLSMVETATYGTWRLFHSRPATADEIAAHLRPAAEGDSDAG